MRHVNTTSIKFKGVEITVSLDITREFISEQNTVITEEGMSDENAKMKLARPWVYTSILVGLIPEFRGYKPCELYDHIAVGREGSWLEVTDGNLQEGDKLSRLDLNFIIRDAIFKYEEEHLKGVEWCLDSSGEQITDVPMQSIAIKRSINTEIGVRLLLDIEPQSSDIGKENYLKRGKFYNSHNIIHGASNGGDTYKNIGKAYSLWLCKSSLGFTGHTGVFKSIEVAGESDPYTGEISGIENTNLEEVIVVSIPRYLKYLSENLNQNGANAARAALHGLLTHYSGEDINVLSSEYKQFVNVEGGAIMDERIRLYKKEGREEGREEGSIIGSIEMLLELNINKQGIRDKIISKYGDTDLTKKLLSQYNI